MNFPDFIIAGAAKCGTSSLCNYLNRHPKIFITQPKELDFFGREGVEVKMEKYCMHFQNKGDRIAGEGSVSYMPYSELAAPQIKKYIPDVKLIFMLRNPVERFYSEFWFNVNRGAVVNKKGLFEDVVFNRKMVHGPSDQGQTYRESLIHRGLYAQQIKKFSQYFGKHQMHLIFFEDFVKNKEKVLQEVFDFLGVDGASLEIPKEVYNKTQYPGKMNAVYVLWKRIKPYLPQQFIARHRKKFLKAKDWFFTEKKAPFSNEARKELIKIYSDSIIELEELSNRNLSHWKK